MTDSGIYGGDSMGFGCCGVGVDQVRNFLTREERIALLKEYWNETIELARHLFIQPILLSCNQKYSPWEN